MIDILNPYAELIKRNPYGQVFEFVLNLPSDLLKSEVWKQSPDLPDYEVSNLGKVRNIHSKHIHKQKITLSNGYPYVDLHNTSWYVHRLVCNAFFKMPEGFQMVVNHIDRVTTNNRADNLEWCTYSENGYHWIAEYGDDPKYDTVSITDGITVKYVTSADSKLYRETGKWIYGNNKPDVPPQYSSDNIWIHNKELNARTVIQESNFEFYEKQGWERGSNNHKVKGYKTINKDGKERVVDPGELNFHLMEGWELGGIRKTNKGRKPIHKDGQCKMVPEDELQSYLDGGWARGYGKKRDKFKVIHNITTNKEMHVKPEEVDKYLSTGEWVMGARTDRMHIHKGDESKFINVKEWEKYKSEGWLKGRSEAIKKKISKTKLHTRKLF